MLPECLPPGVLACLTLCGASQQTHLREVEAEVGTEEPSVVLIATAGPVMGCASVPAQWFSPARLFATSWTWSCSWPPGSSVHGVGVPQTLLLQTSSCPSGPPRPATSASPGDTLEMPALSHPSWCGLGVSRLYSLIAWFNPGSDTYHFRGFWQVT